MAESKTTISTVSRRSARMYVDEHGVEEFKSNNTHRDTTKSVSSEEKAVEKERERERERGSSHRASRSSSNSVERASAQKVDLGQDLGEMFPTTVEEMGKQVTKSLQAANDAVNERVDGQPINFGTVIPGRIYRSSFPMTEDFEYIRTLGLKTIVSLVQKDFDPEFKNFMLANGINHIVINMDGTKKVAIPEATMHSIMEVVLDQKNQPLLIHCNHGKHRTGCAVAVLRLVAGWSVEQTVAEYEGHAAPKIRECDVKYIGAYQISSLSSLLSHTSAPTTSSTSQPVPVPPRTASRFRFMLVSAAALFIWATTWKSFIRE